MNVRLLPADTWVVRLTSPGRAAVASLVVAGPDATSCVNRHFNPAAGRVLADYPCGQIVFGRWLSGEQAEEVVVCRRDADRVEIHCHGGTAASRAIVARLAQSGCREIDWQDWVRHAARDPLVADAQIALADTLTERTAMILLDQQAGALTHAIGEIAALVAAGDGQAAADRIERVLGWQRLGAHLVTPWKVVLAGRPNVGKSSLINALVGYQRAIVHPTPGTTRDVVTAVTSVEGWPIELADTAGLRGGGEPLEAAGMQRARNSLRAAELVVLVFDLRDPGSRDDETLKSEWPQALHVFNKCDLVAGQAAGPGIVTSAVRGDGLGKLQRALAQRLVPHVPPTGEAIPFLPAHVETLAEARTAIIAGLMTDALTLLNRLIAC